MPTEELAFCSGELYRLRGGPDHHARVAAQGARELLGVEPFELPGGHCPNVSRPEALADILERIE